MKTYLLFGIEGDQLEVARARIERALRIKMELHDSDYLGGEYYRLGHVGGEHFILRKNFNEFEQEWTEPSCMHCALLLFANETDRATDICTALADEASLVSRKDL